mgnify:CR=1 FL=1
MSGRTDPCPLCRKLRDEGLSAKEIAEKLEEKKKDVCVLAVFDTLSI